ncbi:MAG: DNA repair protein RecN [Pseudomonadota bacterium]
MLSEIIIKDFAIIQTLHLELETGMTAVTGETGAGKSIVIDALSFAMGDRFDTNVIRHEQDHAEVCVAFAFEGHSPACHWLEEKAMANKDQCVIRRILRRSGRSQSYINGHPVTLQMLKELSKQLIDIHGQHEHQSLVQTETQRHLLDLYANNQNLLAKLTDLYRDYSQCRHDIEQLKQQQDDNDARLELLSYQVAEMNELSPIEGEYEALDLEHTQLANADLLQHELHTAIHRLNEQDDNAILPLLDLLSTRFAKLEPMAPQFKNFREQLDEASITLREVTADMRHHVDTIDNEPARLQWVDERLSHYQTLARKHRIEPDQVCQHQSVLQEELESLDSTDDKINVLYEKLEAAKAAYFIVANQLTESRRTAAKRLEPMITQQIADLNMGGGQFDIHFENQGQGLSRFGQEKIEFFVSANPGQPPKPLSKVASGGELSRISLAIQVILAQGGDTPCLIFDEVDVGIGGGTAEIVGKLLRKLGSSSQVLCVTHQGQVAAQAHHHLFVCKTKSQVSTQTAVAKLDQTERIEEIARMIGGLEVTATSKKHAKELLKNAQF